MRMRPEWVVSPTKFSLVPRSGLHYNGGDLRKRWNLQASFGIHFGRGAGKAGCLDERLKGLMQELGNAINESLADSERIAEAIGEIKRAGYDVFLVLEATIGFNKRDEEESADGESRKETRLETTARLETTGKIRLTSQDQKFLRALKIAVDDEQA